MSLLPRAAADPRVRWPSLALAAGLPFALYVATASAHDYWLDSGEFVSSAVELGVAHPPGFPLASLLGKAFSFLPLGPLPFRVALMSAVAAAFGAGFLFRAVETTAYACGLRSPRVAVPLALAATWLVACCPGWWLQAVRPEVYALHACLACIAIERIVFLEASWPTSDVRPLYVACLALGLALANHHYLAFVLLPALAPTLARVYRARGMGALLRALACGALGMLPYVYLPVRAQAAPGVAIGDPRTLQNLFWVVSAQVYNHPVYGAEHVPLLDKIFAVFERFHAQLGWTPMLLAVLGAYAMLRTPGVRRVGYVWLAVLVMLIVARTYHGPSRDDPDALGYLDEGYVAIAGLAAGLVASVLARLGQASSERPPWWAITAVTALALASLTELPRGEARATLAKFHATDDFDDARYRDLPHGALLLSHFPFTSFRAWSIESCERLRPDITVVPMPLLGYPGIVDALAQRDPALTPLLRAYLLEGELRAPELQSLAASRPVLIEMDPRVPPALYETMVPAGLFHEVLADGATEADERERARLQAELVERVEGRLAADVGRDPETRNTLVWTHYTNALYFAGFGDRAQARVSVARGLALSPESRELRLMSRALADLEGRGPLDVRAFFPE